MIAPEKRRSACNLVVVMKNGHAFSLRLSDARALYEILEKACESKAEDHVAVIDDLWLNVNEIAVIHPAKWSDHLLN